MHRFFADSERSRDDIVYLTAEDSHHALDVLRLKAGASVELIANGHPWTAEIVSTDNRIVCVRKISALPSTEPKLSVTLFQGIPKSDKMDWIVQKATELGVSRVVPVEMSRCIVRINPRDCTGKLERWRKISREAGKQSGRCLLPEICPPAGLGQLGDSVKLPELNIVPWEETGQFGPAAVHEAHPDASSVGILIGPEGGITEEEIIHLKQKSFLPITLGSRILRTETAGLAAVAALMALYGEMEHV